MSRTTAARQARRAVPTPAHLSRGAAGLGPPVQEQQQLDPLQHQVAGSGSRFHAAATALSCTSTVVERQQHKLARVALACRIYWMALGAGPDYLNVLKWKDGYLASTKANGKPVAQSA